MCVFGREFGLLEIFVECYLFLGLGLVICILGEVIWEKVDIFWCVDLIYFEEIRVVGFYNEIW